MGKGKKKLRSNQSVGTWIAVLLLLMGGLLFYTWCRVQCTKTGYAILEERRKSKKLSNLKENLKVEIAGLRSPDRIGRIARDQLGLVVPDPEQIVTIP